MSTISHWVVAFSYECDTKEQARGLKKQLDAALEDAFQDGEIDETEVRIEEIAS